MKASKGGDAQNAIAAINAALAEADGLLKKYPQYRNLVGARAALRDAIQAELKKAPGIDAASSPSPLPAPRGGREYKGEFDHTAITARIEIEDLGPVSGIFHPDDDEGRQYRFNGQNTEDGVIEISEITLGEQNIGTAQLTNTKTDDAITWNGVIQSPDGNHIAIQFHRPRNNDAAIGSPGIELPAQQKSAEDYRIQGETKQNNGDLDGAIADYSHAIKLDPKYAIAYHDRGYAKRLKQDLDGAIADYSRAIELNPKSAGVYCDRGYAKRLKGDLDGAVADYDRAIELDPAQADFYMKRGGAKWKKGDNEGAAADRNRAMKLDPTIRP